jgi:hypothetical protein
MTKRQIQMQIRIRLRSGTLFHTRLFFRCGQESSCDTVSFMFCCGKHHACIYSFLGHKYSRCLYTHRLKSSPQSLNTSRSIEHRTLQAHTLSITDRQHSSVPYKHGLSPRFFNDNGPQLQRPHRHPLPQNHCNCIHLDL